MPMNRMLKSTISLALAMLLGCSAIPPVEAQQAYRFDGVERVVAFGDIHGDIDVLTTVLRGTGVVDDHLNWQGGRTHLVSTGDLIDRGDYGRQVLELLMRLEGEAEAAGGKVHVLLGNHEAMVVSGDLRYVSAGDFEQYGGRAAHRAAFAPGGLIGRWLLDKPVMIVVNGTAFAHGGLSSELIGRSLEQVNQSAHRDLRSFVDGWHALIASGELDAEANFDAIRSRARTIAAGHADQFLQSVAAGMVSAAEGLPFTRDGPLWYRGSSLCHPFSETEVVTAVLRSIRAERVAVGHTITHDHHIATRMDGRVIRMDTGMNSSAYNGRPSALIIEGPSMRAFYPGEGFAALPAEPNRVWDRPYGMSDDEIEDFLLNAPIVESEEIGTGVTRPLRLTLERDGRRMRAAFGREDSDPHLERRSWHRQADFADRYVYNVVAYKLDRIMGLEMVPVSVLRTVDGEPGAVTYWIEGAINETDRRRREVPFGGHCDINAMYNLMNVFDILVFNADRNLGNILYDTRTWNLWLIDHTRAFSSQRGIPRMVSGARIHISPEMDAALRRITRDHLGPIEPYLHRRQVQALIERASRLRRR